MIKNNKSEFIFKYKKQLFIILLKNIKSNAGRHFGQCESQYARGGGKKRGLLIEWEGSNDRFVANAASYSGFGL
jgi:hypothetical protein